MPLEESNAHTHLEAAISEQILARAFSVIQSMRSEIIGSISVGFSTLPIATRSGSTQSGPSDPVICPHPSLLTSLCSFLSNPNASFKTPAQAEALEVVVNGKEHLLLIRLTAMGKSLIYVLPAALFDRTLITLVLLPLSSLHLDFEH